MVGLATGRPAQLLSALPEAERRTRVLDHYAAMYGAEARDPLLYFDADWVTEDFSGGCFAGSLPVNMLASRGPWLRAPCGPLLWASTESATEFTAYMEGALRSRQRAAGEVLASPVRARPRL